MRIEKIKQYVDAMHRFQQFEIGDRSEERRHWFDTFVKLEDEMTDMERRIAFRMADGPSSSPN